MTAAGPGPPPAAAPHRVPWGRVLGFLIVVASLSVLTVAVDSSDTRAGDLDVRNARPFIQDNLWTTDEGQYAVWVGHGGLPRLGFRSTGSSDWSVTDLSLISGDPLRTPTVDDSHNVYVVAVDPLGHVHVAGNMHADPLVYIRTARPGRLDEWITPDIGGPSDRVTYPKFAALPDGTLLFFRRDGWPSMGDILADRLDPGSEQWTHLGKILDGASTPEGVYLQHVAVDPDTGSIHLGVVWRTGPSHLFNNDVSYLRSDDRGTTWRRSDGSAYSLPVTHDSIEIVWDTPESGRGLTASGGMVIDSNGRPHIVVSDPAGPRHLWLDDTGWQNETVAVQYDTPRPSLARGADDTVWLIGVRGGQIRYLPIYPELGDELEGPDAARRHEVTYDTQAMQRFDRLEMLIINRGDDGPTVESLTLTPP